MTGDLFDQGILDDFILEIDWDDDGTFDETVNLPAGSTTIDQSHSYGNKQAGSTDYTVNVRLQDKDMAIDTPNTYVTASTTADSSRLNCTATC